MINPKLIEMYGERSRVFFNRLVEKLSNEQIDKCYALISFGSVNSKDLVAPSVIGVLTDDRLESAIISGVCMDISFELREEFDERDYFVNGLKCNKKELEGDSIKVWVG